jgi:hypothetical protein
VSINGNTGRLMGVTEAGRIDENGGSWMTAATRSRTCWPLVLLLLLLGACERPMLPEDAPPTIQAAVAATATAATLVPTPVPSATPRLPVGTSTRPPLSTRVPAVVPTATAIVAIDVTEAEYLETWRTIRLDVRASLQRLTEWCPWSGSSEVEQQVALLIRAQEYQAWQAFAPRLHGLRPPARLQTLHGYTTTALDALARAGQVFQAAESMRSTEPVFVAAGIRTGFEAFGAFLAAVSQSENELFDLGVEPLGPAGMRLSVRRAEGSGALDILGCLQAARQPEVRPALRTA